VNPKALEGPPAPLSPPKHDPPIMAYFRFDHLPPGLASVSRPVGELARLMADSLPPGPELSAGLRKLLEAKDCFVRAKITP
jgi:hypothetical protein